MTLNKIASEEQCLEQDNSLGKPPVLLLCPAPVRSPCLITLTEGQFSCKVTLIGFSHSRLMSFRGQYPTAYISRLHPLTQGGRLFHLLCPESHLGVADAQCLFMKWVNKSNVAEGISLPKVFFLIWPQFSNSAPHSSHFYNNRSDDYHLT